MGFNEGKAESERKALSLCKMPFWQTSNNATSSSSTSTTTTSSSSTSSSSMSSNNSNGNNACQQNQSSQLGETMSTGYSINTMSFVTKSLLPTRRRLRLDPPNKLFFPCKDVSLALYVI